MGHLVKVKWGGRVIHVEAEETETGADFKKKLWNETKVPPSRQKIIGFKGGILSDTSILADAALRTGLNVMLVGTPEGSEIQTQKESTVFEEDLPISERMQLLKEHDIHPIPKGLVNCGTTCYFNAVIQFLRPVEEFTTAMKKLQTRGGVSDIDASFCAALRSFYQVKELSDSPDNPMCLLYLLRAKFPQFATMAPGSKNYMQQDAEECLSVLFEFLNSTCTDSFVDDLFSLTLDSIIESTEEPEENDPIKQQEKLRILPCYLGAQLSAVDHLDQGIERSLTQKFTRFSTQLGREVECQRKSKISILPNYLIVHFVRFEWKARRELPGSEAGSAKICRKVSFPITFDMYNFVTNELQQELNVARRLDEEHKQKDELGSKLKRQKPDPADLSTSTHTLRKEESPASSDEESPQASPDSSHCNLPTGAYELASIITHQGRSADKGHYIAWTKHDEDTWWKFDDDDVSECSWKNIDLSGGRSDYHIAVLLLYKKKHIGTTVEGVAAMKEKLQQQN